MDGTLTDSEKIWFSAETEVFHDLGHELDAEEAKKVIGMAITDSTVFLAELIGNEVTPKEIQTRLLDKVQEIAARDGLPWRPGAVELLQLTHKLGIPTALVTSSFRSFAQYALDKAPTGTLTVVVTGDVVPYGKPHPAPYLMAAAELGVDIKQCLAFEDSIPGLTSAYRSGAKAIGVPFQIQLPQFDGAIYVDSLDDIDEEFLRTVFA